MKNTLPHSRHVRWAESVRSINPTILSATNFSLTHVSFTCSRARWAEKERGRIPKDPPLPHLDAQVTRPAPGQQFIVYGPRERGQWEPAHGDLTISGADSSPLSRTWIPFW